MTSQGNEADRLADLDLDAALRERFGFDAFRPGQREAIEALLGGEDLLCIQPTGHGKSLLYQLPAAVMGGLTLVISPLLALMRDQLDHLTERFGIPAASLNSDQTLEENEDARRRAARGEISILFVAPEQLDNIERLRFLTGLDLRLVVVDEAHCISTWGHDFRPAYREIARLITEVRRRGGVRVLGLTATADARTEADIQRQLAPVTVHRRSMDRPNLALFRSPVRSFGHKLELLDRRLRELDPCGLIYCATRENTEIVAEYLAAQGHGVVAYHAGLDPDRKRQLQADFLAGRFDAIAATNALGMGIDKSDLRYVLHADVPGSITAYYQEVGRAGRDGLPARGELIYDPADRKIQAYFIHSARPERADFEAILAATAAEPLRLTDIKRQTGLHPTRVTVVTAELVEQGYLQKIARKRVQLYERTGLHGEPDLSRYANQQIARTDGLDRMIALAEGRTGCLMRTLRASLGDDEAGDCGRCGACLDAPAASEGSGAADAWLAARPVLLPGSGRTGIAQGRALFDSNRRSRDFVDFMRGRAGGLDDALVQRLASVASGLGPLAGVAPIPSRTWPWRDAAARLADALGIPLVEGLIWLDPPEARQGELLNNDQRRANVKGRLAFDGRAPSGALLLFDDYTGSGSTLREAARALKRAGHGGSFVPLTVAKVRWRLGRPGIV